MDRFKKDLPNYLTYHNAAHTRYVLDKARLIAKEEKVEGDQLELVQIAALYHDSGFLNGMVDHENEGCEIAKAELPLYGFSALQIQEICQMITATKIPQRPQNLLGRIVADADLEYLGTDLFDLGSQRLFDELRNFNTSLTHMEWLKIQIGFLESHQYHTDYCQEFRQPKKMEHLARLKEEFLTAR
ncbi:HD domain-containing protein [Lunatibacter salilacus]|uniref:HD domain-containing protein n=1 Tax=Lunatibacter salilacus TaxID=2483804 RepID=UPI00131E9D74|nr:HD domain-containing protein [Lunatibacter salilacus]